MKLPIVTKKFMKLKLYLPHIFFSILLFSFLFLILFYDFTKNKKKTISCNDLNFELSKNLLPENFSSLTMTLDFLDNKKWWLDSLTREYIIQIIVMAEPIFRDWQLWAPTFLNKDNLNLDL